MHLCEAPSRTTITNRPSPSLPATTSTITTNHGTPSSMLTDLYNISLHRVSLLSAIFFYFHLLFLLLNLLFSLTITSVDTSIAPPFTLLIRYNILPCNSMWNLKCPFSSCRSLTCDELLSRLHHFETTGCVSRNRFSNHAQARLQTEWLGWFPLLTFAFETDFPGTVWPILTDALSWQDCFWFATDVCYSVIWLYQFVTYLWKLNAPKPCCNFLSSFKNFWILQPSSLGNSNHQIDVFRVVSTQRSFFLSQNMCDFSFVKGIWLQDVF